MSVLPALCVPVRQRGARCDGDPAWVRDRAPGAASARKCARGGQL